MKAAAIHEIYRLYFIGKTHVLVTDEWLIRSLPDTAKRNVKNFSVIEIDGKCCHLEGVLPGYGFIYRIE